MKKTVVLLVVMLVSAGLFAEGAKGNLSFGLSAGGSYAHIDISPFEDAGMDATTLGVPVSVEVLYSLGKITEIPGQGDLTLDVGIKSSYLNLYSAKKDKISANSFTIPVLAYGKATMGNYFVGLGLGIHAWSAKFDFGVVDGEDNGIEFCSLIEPGYKFILTDNITLLGSLGIYTTSYESDSGEEDAAVITLNIGINYAL